MLACDNRALEQPAVGAYSAPFHGFRYEEKIYDFP